MHAFVVALVKLEHPDEAEDALEQLMHPYGCESEEFLEEYEEACWSCNGGEDPPENAEITCTECNGTGTYIARYNPNAQWDWYVIGGRWNGILTGKTSTMDTYTDDTENNTIPVKTLIELVKFQRRVPAYVVSDTIGWVAGDEKMFQIGNLGDDWHKEFLRILEQHDDYYAVGVDIHC